jgi:hypothetical protein
MKSEKKGEYLTTRELGMIGKLYYEKFLISRLYSPAAIISTGQIKDNEVEYAAEMSNA